MRVYEIFRRSDQSLQAVKRGFSWPGFCFSWAWAWSRRLWFPGMLLFLASIPVAVLARSVQEPVYGIVLGLIYSMVTGFKGNSWRSRDLENRGCQFLGAIKARDSQDAVAKVTASGGVIPAQLKVLGGSTILPGAPRFCQRIFAVVVLTWTAAFRYRLFWVLTSLLLAAVVGLPLLLKDDGTAEGFTQILLTYTLASVTAILGICTLWLACGTLARDIEECQMQMVVVKPVARWQIWLGKWLGLVTLNAALLAISGLGVYGLLEWRAQSLPVRERARLNAEVLVARGSLRDNIDSFVDEQTERGFADRLKKNDLQGANPVLAKQQLREQIKSAVQQVPPGGTRVIPWIIHLGRARESLKNEPLFLRIKFNTADGSETGTYVGQLAVGLDTSARKYLSPPMSLSPGSFHELPIPPDLADAKGDLYIFYLNDSGSTLLFPLDEGFEVLYRQGGFGLNFIRGLGIILCWIALLATLGLAAASLLSFPVAAFFCLGLLTIGLSSGTLANVVQEGTLMGENEENGVKTGSAVDFVGVPVFRVMLDVIDLVKDFSPIDALSTGRLISWTQLGRAAAQIVLLLGGILGLLGILFFNRRELAAAQGGS